MNDKIDFRICSITNEEYENNEEYNCMPEYAEPTLCEGCKWYKWFYKELEGSIDEDIYEERYETK